MSQENQFRIIDIDIVIYEKDICIRMCVCVCVLIPANTYGTAIQLFFQPHFYKSQLSKFLFV